MCFTTIPIANVSAATDVPVAKNQYLVVPGGDTIGLHMDTGVYIAGKYQVETRDGKVSPWRKSEVREGDKIIKINNVQVKTNQDLLDALASINSNTVDLVIKRGDMTFRTTFDVAISRSGDKSLGLYIKDKVVGVGTLTFIDPKTNRFAALGHGIFDNKVNDQDVGGNILSSNVESIKKAAPGIPGEKRAMLDKMTIGNITKNKITGIYGNITNRSYTSNRKLLPVAMKNDVKVGKAEILTVIEDDKVEAFDIEIVEVKKQTAKSVKGIKIKVIDRDLLNKTGGIIQGMSGSPIIQNNQLVGAVSHVIVDSPQYGYGIFVEWMLLDCGLSVNY
ncbi:MAG: SpoIVB peptidase [Bacilli bacterium]|nr:SpoIVB peptidase [Acholeplasmataceae bacterium]